MAQLDFNQMEENEVEILKSVINGEFSHVVSDSKAGRLICKIENHLSHKKAGNGTGEIEMYVGDLAGKLINAIQSGDITAKNRESISMEGCEFQAETSDAKSPSEISSLFIKSETKEEIEDAAQDSEEDLKMDSRFENGFCEKSSLTGEIFRSSFKPSKEKEAAKYNLSRQAYEKRLKTWVEVVINDEKYLVNPNQIMKLID